MIARMAAVRVFLFDRWLEIDREKRLVRVVPLRIPSVVTGVTMLSVPVALLMTVRPGERELTGTGIGFVVGYALLALAFITVPFARSNTLVELDLVKKVARRLGAETPLSEAALRFVFSDRRGAAFATIGGKEVRFLYLANDFTEIARLVIHAAAEAMRGEPPTLLAELATEAKRHEWKAYVVHLLLPLAMIGLGAVFYRLYLP
jgi:hypothetical protein